MVARKRKESVKLENKEQGNYSAIVVEVKKLVQFDNCANVQATIIFGFQCIVGKDVQIGDLGVFFMAETQLSDDYCKYNNLFRHSEKNEDQEKSGYLEDNKRIKAVKFRGHRSDGLFMPLSSLNWTSIDSNKLKAKDEFDHVEGKEVCRKYVRKIRVPKGNKQQKAKRFNRVDPEFFPEHFRTDHFLKYVSDLDPTTEVIVSQKLEGTSIRAGHTKVKRKLTLRDKIAQVLGAKVQKHEYDYIFGSRKVVKDPDNKDQVHYYDVDIWSLEGEKLRGLLPENYMIFGELIGWTPGGAAIQPHYTYGIPHGECELYIYRVVFINDKGVSQDMSWDHMVEFLEERDLKVTPEIWRGKLEDLDISQYLDKRLFEEGHRSCLDLGVPKIVDEGVVVRIDKKQIYNLKAKSPLYVNLKSKDMDKDLPDLEEEQS